MDDFAAFVFYDGLLTGAGLFMLPVWVAFTVIALCWLVIYLVLLAAFKWVGAKLGAEFRRA